MQFRRQTPKERERRYFTAARDAMALPDLIEIQKSSYRWFLEDGIRELLKEISPIPPFGPLLINLKSRSLLVLLSQPMYQ